MKHFIMKCGHTNIKPYCPYCDCNQVAEVKNSQKIPDRIAVSVISGRRLPSNLTLPGFMYLPNHPFDLYDTQLKIARNQKHYFNYLKYIKEKTIEK